jgi:hypothetical protein
MVTAVGCRNLLIFNSECTDVLYGQYNNMHIVMNKNIKYNGLLIRNEYITTIDSYNNNA